MSLQNLSASTSNTMAPPAGLLAAHELQQPQTQDVLKYVDYLIRQEMMRVAPAGEPNSTFVTRLDGMPASLDLNISANADAAPADRLAVLAKWLGLGAQLTQEVAAPPTEVGLAKWRLKRVAAYIDEHLAESISLADLAECAGFSRMYFAAQFRSATGCSPHDYVLRKRVERAQQLLSEPKMTLVEIALSVGFQTQAHFTTVFKSLVGATPLSWRRANAFA